MCVCVCTRMEKRSVRCEIIIKVPRRKEKPWEILNNQFHGRVHPPSGARGSACDRAWGLLDRDRGGKGIRVVCARTGLADGTEGGHTVGTRFLILSRARPSPTHSLSLPLSLTISLTLSLSLCTHTHIIISYTFRGANLRPRRTHIPTARSLFTHRRPNGYRSLRQYTCVRVRARANGGGDGRRHLCVFLSICGRARERRRRRRRRVAAKAGVRGRGARVAGGGESVCLHPPPSPRTGRRTRVPCLSAVGVVGGRRRRRKGAAAKGQHVRWVCVRDVYAFLRGLRGVPLAGFGRVREV